MVDRRSRAARQDERRDRDLAEPRRDVAVRHELAAPGAGGGAYVPEAPATEKARQHWAANMQLAMDAVAAEDFPLGEGIQRGFRSGAQDHVTYGRNEPALIHFHRSLRRALGLDGAE